VTDHDITGSLDRRTFLAGATAAGIAGLAGCADDGDSDGSDGTEDGTDSIEELGYGREGREVGGTPMADMPALEGELTVYSGRAEFLVGPLVDHIASRYDGFSLDVRYSDSTDLVNQIDNEGEGTPADVFYSVNAGSLGALADAGRTQSLPEGLREFVGGEFRTDRWIGTSGRARSVPFNTDALSDDDVPDDITDFPEEIDAELGWAPSYGSCQAFVTAMRVLEGEETTREWLQSVVDAGIRSYPGEFAACQAIADGEIDAGFTNHYYVQRVIEGREDPPIATAFTEGDAGAVFNVAGAAVVDAAADGELAENFVRHLLSSEAQDYFAVRTYEYPLVADVPPVGELPSIDELDVPELDLSRLSNLEETVDLMREVGIDV